jgi:signal transduction histidine kinase
MTAPPAGLAGDISIRDLLSSFSALQVLSMVMVDASSEEEILNLAVSAVPSLGRDCRVEGVWLDGQWRTVTSPRGHIGRPAGVEDQLALLGGEGGLLSSPEAGWLCAFSTTSQGAASGCLVVSSPEAPAQHEQALLQTLAQQTGVTLSRTRLLLQERRMHERIADEQATLRRVAGLISQGAPPEKVFAAVAAEAGRLLGADSAVMSRYGTDGAVTVVGAWAKGDGDHPSPSGTSLGQEGTNVHALAVGTSNPSRVDVYGDDKSKDEIIARPRSVRSVVGVPIRIGGHLWGEIGVVFRRAELVPTDTEEWLTGFTQLVATAIASAQAQEELRDHAEEQSALRRVATLVARAAAPEEMFDAVAEEIGRLLDVDFAIVSRYDRAGGAEIVGAWSKPNLVHPAAVGTQMQSGGHNIHTLVRTTGRPVRIDDYGDASGPAAKVAGELGIFAAVGAPISVDGGLWGIAAVSRMRPEPLPADTEVRLVEFTELVATALANAQAHAELTASRARIVATADDTRRRIERDLHDGAQQRLVSLALQLRIAQAAAPADTPELAVQLDGVANGLAGVMEDLLEIARGIHPGILANGGLRPALKTLARRSALPVALEVTVDGRLAEQVELAAYYAVAEALTNAAKHAHASVVDVRVMEHADRLDVWIHDDGLGGAEIGRGSGLEGLMDRVRTLNGDMSLHSPPGGGTTLEISLPLSRPF